MSWIKKKLKQSLNRIMRGNEFNIGAREHRGRQEFFYNSFKALSFNGISGDYVEFGSCGCMTFALAYHEATRHGHKAKLWAFDSFQGLPAPKEAKDSHPAWIEGAMSTGVEKFHKLCTAQHVPRDAYEVVPGFYDKTLPTMSATEEPKDIALAYVDCDLYSSTKSVLEFIYPRLKHGMIIAFDDYFCWSATQISGERMAMLDKFWENSEWQLLPYLPFGWHGFSFVVEDKRLSLRIQSEASCIRG